MTEQIKATLGEYEEVIGEMKQLSIQLKTLRESKKELEDKIIEYLDETGEIGIKYNNITFINDKKTVRKPKKKKEKEASAISILRKNGIRDASEVLSEMLDSMKGESQVVTKLKMNGMKG